MKSLIALSAAFAFISVFAFAKWVRSPSDAPSVLPTATAEVHFLEQELQLGTVRLNEQIGGSLTILNDTDQPVRSSGRALKSEGCNWPTWQPMSFVGIWTKGQYKAATKSDTS